MNVDQVVHQIGLLHSVGSETATDFELATDIVNQLKCNWADPNFRLVDPSCGRGNFLLAAYNRLLAAGHRPKHIVKKMLYGCDINKTQAMITTKALTLVSGAKPNIYCDDSLTRKWNMRFDVGVGNPPYQRTDNKAKRWTLWEEFVKKTMDIADTVALVVPQSVTSPNASFDLIKDRCSVLNIDVSKHFTVGSTFCYFIAHNNKKVTKTKIITADSVYTRDISQAPFLPAVINNDTLKQLDDLLARPKKRWHRGELHTSRTEIFTVTGRYPVMHTNAQTLQTDFEHKNRTKIRVAVSLSGYPQFRVLQNEYASQACFWTEFKTVREAKQFAKECNSKDIQDMLTIFKWSGWNSKEVIQCL
jgi:hypothetical protein